MAGFNPKQYIIKLQNKDYLEVKWRVVWFREQHPGGAISTELISTDPTVIVRAQITGADGAVLAADYGTAPAAGKGTWTGRAVEKASTAAVGRALALAGFGTQFDGDDEGDNLADSPVERPRAVHTPPTTNATPTPPSAAQSGNPAPAHAWTDSEYDSFVQEAKTLRVDLETVLRILDVPKIRKYAPGFSAAGKALRDFAAAQAKAPAEDADALGIPF